VSPVAARSAYASTRKSLEAIDRLNGDLRACTTVREVALSEAALIDLAVRRGPIAGWTLAVKDNMDVAGTIRSDGLAPPHHPPAAHDSEPVRRLRAAGAVVVAKTNLEELSFGATTQNATWGSCRNPWDRSRVPGGSSGGSAVAVAAGMVDAALGTDTGGSLRNPASFCGLSALRPSHGLVPMEGVTALSPSLDVVGPMARSVVKLGAVLSALTDTARSAEAAGPIRGLAVGVPATFFVDDLEPDVARGYEGLLALLTCRGAHLRKVALPDLEAVTDAVATLLNAEAARTLRGYWSDHRLSAGVQERLLLGRRTPRAMEDAARRVATTWWKTVSDAFLEVELIVTPATPFVAPLVDEGDLVAVSRRINRFTGVWSLLGVPALALPVEPATNDLPVGAQLVSAPGSDRRLLALGAAIQAVSDWHDRTPHFGAGRPER